jgi:hypothetical protein
MAVLTLEATQDGDNAREPPPLLPNYAGILPPLSFDVANSKAGNQYYASSESAVIGMNGVHLFYPILISIQAGARSCGSWACKHWRFC